MSSSLVLSLIVSKIITELRHDKKRIISKGKKNVTGNGKGTSLAYKKRVTLVRQPHSAFDRLKKDFPLWQQRIGCLRPKDIVSIATEVKWQDQRLHKLSQCDRLLLCLLRLRDGSCHSAMCDYFNIGRSTAHTYFWDAVDALIDTYYKSVCLPRPRDRIILESIIRARGDTLPQFVMSFDGKHFRKHGYDASCYSKKLNATARNGLFMVNRATGEIVYMSVNHKAKRHDMRAFNESSILSDPHQRNYLFQNWLVVADLGFQAQGLWGVYTPEFSDEMNEWTDLTAEERKASGYVRTAQKSIENTFAVIFWNKYKLAERVRGFDPTGTRQARIIIVCVILHNLAIRKTGLCLFDDAFTRLRMLIDNSTN